MKYEKGQMFELSWFDKEGHARWQYMVAIELYDDRTEFTKEYGGRFMEFVSNDESKDKEPDSKDNHKIKVIPLYKEGQVIFSKRSFFGLGRYTFEPTTKGR
jgi:hypothetical protein